MTTVKPDRLRIGDRVRLERDSLAAEGYIKRFENGDRIHLDGDERSYSVEVWHVDLIGRIEPLPFSVIRFPEVYNRPAFVRREDALWARIPSPFDTAAHDPAADRKLTLREITEHYGWDFEVATVGGTSSDTGGAS